MRTYYSIGEMKIVHTAEAYDIERFRVEIARLREALEGVIRIADRDCPEFRAARAALVSQCLVLDCARYSKGQYRHLEPAGARDRLAQKPYCNWRGNK